MKVKKILITGGPVHAHLDDVKIITNRFKGGLMAQLATQLSERRADVTYLCAPSVGARVPYEFESTSLRVVSHSGFDDYRQKVLEIAPNMDAIILGAAVANLIPARRFPGKFSSHNYKPGDIIPIDFTIAPRVVDEVKRVAPRAHVFGYKLLSGVPHEELIHAAYDIVMASGAAAVFANDATNLQQKYAVTKERGVHPVRQGDLAGWIWEMINDIYYATAFSDLSAPPDRVVEEVHELIDEYQDHFPITQSGLIFGTVAVRYQSGFVTTGRGKRELDSIAYVVHVDHNEHKVYVADQAKASLNAPLLARMFENTNVHSIVHYHEQVPGIPVVPYAPPGTVRDTERSHSTSFNIKEHGCILLFDGAGRQI